MLAELLQQTEYQRKAEEAAANKQEAERATMRVLARKDSIQRVEMAYNAKRSSAIYAPDGTPRSDTTFRVATSAIDSLNDELLTAMFQAASIVFHTGPEAELHWETLANIVRVDHPVIWSQRVKKVGRMFKFEDLITGDPGGPIRLKLYSELILQKVAHFLADGEVLVVPYRVVLDPSVSGTNVRLNAADGYVNILLGPIPKVDVKD
jgi:hypothetical protein